MPARQKQRAAPSPYPPALPPPPPLTDLTRAENCAQCAHAFSPARWWTGGSTKHACAHCGAVVCRKCSTDLLVPKYAALGRGVPVCTYCAPAVSLESSVLLPPDPTAQSGDAVSADTAALRLPVHALKAYARAYQMTPPGGGDWIEKRDLVAAVVAAARGPDAAREAAFRARRARLPPGAVLGDVGPPVRSTPYSYIPQPPAAAAPPGPSSSSGSTAAPTPAPTPTAPVPTSAPTPAPTPAMSSTEPEQSEPEQRHASSRPRTASSPAGPPPPPVLVTPPPPVPPTPPHSSSSSSSTSGSTATGQRPPSSSGSSSRSRSQPPPTDRRPMPATGLPEDLDSVLAEFAMFMSERRAAANARPPPAHAATAKADLPTVKMLVEHHADPSKMPVRDLKGILAANHVSLPLGVVEKSDLAARVQRLMDDWVRTHLAPAAADVISSSTDPSAAGAAAAAAATSPTTPRPAAGVMGEECKVCFDNLVDCVLLECGHVGVCGECADKMHECPFCREPISRVVRMFRA